MRSPIHTLISNINLEEKSYNLKGKFLHDTIEQVFSGVDRNLKRIQIYQIEVADSTGTVILRYTSEQKDFVEGTTYALFSNAKIMYKDRHISLRINNWGNMSELNDEDSKELESLGINKENKMSDKEMMRKPRYKRERKEDVAVGEEKV